MNKKGFTLIELLAVIVILAIIALIATPVVLNIIKDSKDSSQLRSSEFYLDAVSNSILRKQMNNGEPFTPTECEILNDGNLICDDNVKVEVDIDGDKPTSGKIKFENGSISKVEMELGGKTIIRNEEGKLVYQTGEKENKLNDICNYDQTSTVPEKTAGAKYNCKVDPNEDEYTFYVLTTPTKNDTSINLIMDQNINSDGTPAGKTGISNKNPSQYNLMSWYNENGQTTNIYGPVTAMQFLYNATKSWTSVEPINYTYNDKEVQGTTVDNASYISFISVNGIATITPLTGDGVTIGTKDEPLRARMIMYSSDETITEVLDKTSAPYLYYNLNNTDSSAPYGYWTLSSSTNSSNSAVFVDYSGRTSSCGLIYAYRHGVRPVITLNI